MTIEKIINSSLGANTPLCELFERHGSDKCSDWHNYSPLYYNLFKGLIDKPVNFFELGIFQGASIRAWRDFFPKGNIYAADFNKDYLNNEGVTSLFCDQRSPASIIDMWSHVDSNLEFDIIIEDGEHEFASNLTFLNNSISRLKQSGIFIVEDLVVSTKNGFNKIKSQLKQDYNLKYIEVLEIPLATNSIDNNLLIIQK